MAKVVRAGTLVAALMLLSEPSLAAGANPAPTSVSKASSTAEAPADSPQAHGREGRSAAGGSSSTLYLTYRDLVPSVPEPATWAIMMLGFGFAGSAVRRRRTVMPRVFA